MFNKNLESFNIFVIKFLKSYKNSSKNATITFSISQEFFFQFS